MCIHGITKDHLLIIGHCHYDSWIEERFEERAAVIIEDMQKHKTDLRHASDTKIRELKQKHMKNKGSNEENEGVTLVSKFEPRCFKWVGGG